MATPNQANSTSSTPSSGKKPDFSGYLRAIETERFNPANNPEKPLLLNRRINRAREETLNVRLLQATGILVSVVWLTGAAVYIQRSVGWNNVSNMMPHEMGGFLAGILSPIALFWMIAAFILRSNDVKKYAETLREEIQTMIFPSDEADRRVNNDIERLMRQTAEMSKATRMALGAIESARDGLKNEVTVLNDNSGLTVDRLSGLGEALHARMQDVADMGTKLETMLNAMEERARLTTERLDSDRLKLEQAATRLDETGSDLHGKITEAATGSEQSIARLSEMLSERLEALGGLHKETETALQSAADEIAAQRDALRVEADGIEEKSYALTAAIQKSTSDLYTYSDDALDKAKLIETRLQGQATSLQNILAQSTENVGAIADTTEQNVAKLQESVDIQVLNLRQATEFAVEEAAQMQNKMRDSMAQSVTSFADMNTRHASDLDALVTRSTDSMRGATQQAVDTFSTLHDKVHQAAQDTTDSFADMTQRSAEEMNALIASAMDTLRQSIEANMDAVKDTSSTVTDQSKTMADQMAESVSGAVVNFSELMERNRSSFDSMLSDTVSALHSSVEQNTRKLNETAHQAVYEAEKVKDLMQDAVTDSIEKFRHVTGENTNALTVASNEAVDRAEKVESVLQQAISRLEERSGAAVDQAQQVMGKATAHLVGELDQVSERARQMSDSMLAEVNRKIVDTTSAFAYIQKQIQALVALFDERKLDLDQVGSSARETADTLQKTLQLALDKVTDTTRAMETGITSVQKSVQQPIALLENAANFAYNRAGEISAMLGEKAGHLTDTAGKIGADLLGIHDKLTTKGQDVAEIAGKIAVHLRYVTEELNKQGDLMDSRVVNTTSALEEMNKAQQDISSKLALLQEQTTQTTTQSGETAEAIQKRIDVLQQLYQAVSNDAAQSDDNLSRVSDRLVSISTTTVEKVKNSIENMTLLEADYHRLSDAGLTDIQRLEHGYRQLLDTVQNDTQATVQTLASAQDGIEEKTRETRHAMEAQLHVLQETAQKVDETAKAMVASGDVLGTQSARVQDFGQSAYSTLQQVMSLSEQFDTRAARVNDLVSVHVRSIQDSMVQIQDHAASAINTLVQQENSLTDTVKTTEETAQKLQSQLQQLQQESRQAEETLLTSVSRLEDQKQNIGQSATLLAHQIDTAKQQVASESDIMIARLEEAMAKIAGKTNALEQAAKNAQTQAETLREQETKLNRDAFFNSTKFIVESLHSLALDFTRLLDGELQDKTWKAYQKGDVASFTRRLLSARDEETRQKIYGKFKEDVEFRTYIQRYLRQYEEIYDAAAANDHADLLVSVFSGSDVGKLYQFLCAVLERDPRGSKA